MKIRCLFDEMVAVDELVPNPENPNDHSESQINQLITILEYQGWRAPIKVSKRSGSMTAGHGRLMAAKRMGLKQVPVNYQDYDDEAMEYADIVADNAIALQAELNLSKVNAKIPDLGPVFNISTLGLKDFTLDIADRCLPPIDAPLDPKITTCPECDYQWIK
jgi:hypothetical protein